MENITNIIKTLESGVANVQKRQQEINELNVFPVPDGDTGSNMTSTLLSGLNQIYEYQKDIKDVTGIFKYFSQGSLYGARGNSGVITSQIMKGLFEGIRDNAKNLKRPGAVKKILKAMRDSAYNSVPSPVEGTILSITKYVHQEYNSKSNDIVEILKEVVRLANIALENTPNQLEILKKANVVDSGAQGLVYFFEGVLSHYLGRTYRVNLETQHQETKFSKADPNKNIGYCSEFIMTLKDPESFSKDEAMKLLNKIGDSVVLIHDEDILKIHVHTKEPGELFNSFHKFGEFSKIKVDNMTTQVSENVMIEGEGDSFQNEEKDISFTSSIKKQQLSIISVASGSGIVKTMSENGADIVINGGQTMNPSVNDFIDAIGKLDSEEILILPNNSNIIMSAQKAAEITENKKVFVLETKSIQAGIAVLEAIDEEFYPLEDSLDVLEEILQTIHVGQVSFASKDTEMDGVEVKEGHYLATSEKKIISSTPDLFTTTKELLDTLIDKEIEVVRVFYGTEVEEKVLRKIRKYVKKQDVEVKITKGNQEVYHLLIFTE